MIGMADFQYKPDMSDPIAQLRLAMDRMDGEYVQPIPDRLLLAHSTYQGYLVKAIMNYKIPPEKEDYTIPAPGIYTESNLDPQLSGESSNNFISNLRMFPPPIFSRQAIPHLYQ